jgi:hypothetical protein
VDFGFEILGIRSLVFGLWFSVFGLWPLVFGLWPLAFGLWAFGSLAFELRSAVLDRCLHSN